MGCQGIARGLWPRRFSAAVASSLDHPSRTEGDSNRVIFPSENGSEHFSIDAETR
jgi:hypothetical protein